MQTLEALALKMIEMHVNDLTAETVLDDLTRVVLGDKCCTLLACLRFIALSSRVLALRVQEGMRSEVV